ncbi:hypothetical protein KR018_000376, partial [Drosophila ironensis]
RTSLILLDYTQFRAARTIQRNWRKFWFWESLEKRNQAAITIQRHWRGFSARNKYYGRVESMLQERVLGSYNKSATKIQALFRGYKVRKNVHDMVSLKSLQVCAAEDLLNCVAFKLHHLMRTYAIPGVYSLKNSNCLSRVEKLMSSLHFRYFNGRVCQQKIEDAATIETMRQDFKKSQHYNRFPFPGPNYWSKCSPKAEAVLKMSKDIDKRMYKIIEMYDASQKEVHAAAVIKAKASKKKMKHIAQIKKSLERNKRDFCGDVIASMRRWKILQNDNLTVDKNVFKSPANLDKFINDMFKIAADFENCTCYCRIPVYDRIYC